MLTITLTEREQRLLADALRTVDAQARRSLASQLDAPVRDAPDTAKMRRTIDYLDELTVLRQKLMAPRPAAGPRDGPGAGGGPPAGGEQPTAGD